MATVSRSGRVIKKPEYYVPQEKPEDDFRDDEYDDDDDSETDEDDSDEDEEDESDDEDADENGNLKGFIVESESESDCD